jgi:hypothetical protein
MPSSNYRMAFDFFFTNIPNHLEFLKWTRGLRTDDDILLVAALEALHLHYYVPEGTHPGSSEPRSILVQPPFWLDTVHGQNRNNDVSDWHWQDSVLRPMLQDKHPFNVIEGYADLKSSMGMCIMSSNSPI